MIRNNKGAILSFIVFVHCSTLFSSQASVLVSPRTEIPYTEVMQIPLPQSIEFADDLDKLVKIGEQNLITEFRLGFQNAVAKVRTSVVSDYENKVAKIKAESLKKFEQEIASLKGKSQAAFQKSRDNLKIKKQFIEKFKKLEATQHPEKDEKKLTAEAEDCYNTLLAYADILVADYLAKLSVTWDQEEPAQVSK